MIEIWTMLLPAAAPAIWFLFCLTALIKLARYRKRRLLRCPETGGVAPGQSAVFYNQEKVLGGGIIL